MKFMLVLHYATVVCCMSTVVSQGLNTTNSTTNSTVEDQGWDTLNSMWYEGPQYNDSWSILEFLETAYPIDAVSKDAWDFTKCKVTPWGYEFYGSKQDARPWSGMKCHRWDMVLKSSEFKSAPEARSSFGNLTFVGNEMPRARTFVRSWDKEQLGRGFDYTENSCRNPSGLEGGPWCYTYENNPDLKVVPFPWEYCDVPACKPIGAGCKVTDKGTEYNGNWSATTSAGVCAEWAAPGPKRDEIESSDFPEKSIYLAQNFCRNPYGLAMGPNCWDGSVWSDALVPCDIPKCKPIGCKRSKEGSRYTGGAHDTHLGFRCQTWALKKPHESQFPHLEGDYCRNPDNRPEGPWCYTVDANVKWDYCDVPLCGDDGQELGYDTYQNVECEVCQNAVFHVSINAERWHELNRRRDLMCGKWGQSAHNMQKCDRGNVIYGKTLARNGELNKDFVFKCATVNVSYIYEYVFDGTSGDDLVMEVHERGCVAVPKGSPATADDTCFDFTTNPWLMAVSTDIDIGLKFASNPRVHDQNVEGGNVVCFCSSQLGCNVHHTMGGTKQVVIWEPRETSVTTAFVFAYIGLYVWAVTSCAVYKQHKGNMVP